MPMAPTLITDRLTLRPMRVQDWAAYWDFMRSDRARFMGGPFTPDRAWGMFCADLALWALFDCGGLMIEIRDTRETIGQIGVNAGPLFPEWELGWLLYPAWEGAGFAHEAALAMKDWAFGARQLQAMVSYVDPENTRSRALAERLGGQLDLDAARPDPSDLVYRYKP